MHRGDMMLIVSLCCGSMVGLDGATSFLNLENYNLSLDVLYVHFISDIHNMHLFTELNSCTKHNFFPRFWKWKRNATLNAILDQKLDDSYRVCSTHVELSQSKTSLI